MANVNYVSPQAPAIGTRPDGVLGGMMFRRDRALYDDQMETQKYLSGLGMQKETASLQDYFTLRPHKNAADIATYDATAATIGREKEAGVTSTELANKYATGTLDARVGDTNLSFDIKKRKEQREGIQRGLEIAGVLRSAGEQGGPQALAQVMAQLPPGSENDPVVKFISQATDHKDLMGRIDKVMEVYKALDLDFQKALLSHDAAVRKANVEKIPSWQIQMKNALKEKYKAEGFSEMEADFRASRESMTALTGLGGARQQPPETQVGVQTAQKLLQMAAETEQFASMLGGNPKMQEDLRKQAATLRAQAQQLSGGQSGSGPAPAPGPQQHQPKAANEAASMADLRKSYPDKTDAQIKAAYKTKYGFDPKP